MHLSLLSDTGFAHQHRTDRALGRAHRDGVLRGLVFLAIVAVPFGLAVVTGHAGARDASAGYAQNFEQSGLETPAFETSGYETPAYERSGYQTVSTRR